MKMLNYLLVFLTLSCGKTSIDSLPKTSQKFYTPEEFVMGADLSYLQAVEDHGAVFKENNISKDPLAIFKKNGNNLVRVRLWHQPENWQQNLNSGKVYSNLQDVIKLIERAKKAGMQVNLDFHYSDEWADPASQKLPKAWEGLSFDAVKDSVYQYTFQTLQILKDKNLSPEFVQIGNETNQGMLFPHGKITNNNFGSFSQLLQSGIKAVRDFSKNSSIKPQIILHVAQFQNADWFFDGIVNKSGLSDFDIMGISHYYNYTQLQSNTAIEQNIKFLISKYQKKLMIVETAYPWTTQNADNYNNINAGGISSYGISKEGQLQYMKDLSSSVMRAGGSGIIYWEPAWVSSTMNDKWGQGSSWENCTFFDFEGNALPVFDYQSFDYKQN